MSDMVLKVKILLHWRPLLKSTRKAPISRVYLPTSSAPRWGRVFEEKGDRLISLQTAELDSRIALRLISLIVNATYVVVNAHRAPGSTYQCKDTQRN